MISLAASWYFLPRRSRSGRVTGFGPLGIEASSPSADEVSPASLRASLSAFASTSAIAFAERLPAFATFSSAISSVTSSETIVSVTAGALMSSWASTIAASICATVFFSETSRPSFFASSSRLAFLAIGVNPFCGSNDLRLPTLIIIFIL